MAGYNVKDAPAACPIADLPTPCRVREDPCEAKVECPLGACPWDSLAQFLTLPELEWLCCVSASLRAELTIEEDASAKSEEADAAEPTQSTTMSKRKLLAPLLVLKVETAEAELQRVSLTNIRVLRIWNYKSLNILADAVAASGGPKVLRSLERIALKGCPLGEEVIGSFILPTFSHAQLKHLNLEKNQVTDDILCNLVESGALDAASLESMNLRFNRIGSRGVQALASSPCCASLKWVNLKMNQVGDEGAIALAEMLQSNTSMSLLNLRRQTPPLTDRAAIAFASTLKNNSTLEQLRLRQNRISDSGAKALAGEVAGHVKKLQAFHGVGARFELDLEMNRIKEGGGNALLQSLAGISKAVRVELLLHGNPIKYDALMKLAGATEVADPRFSFDSKAEGLLW